MRRGFFLALLAIALLAQACTDPFVVVTVRGDEVGSARSFQMRIWLGDLEMNPQEIVLDDKGLDGSDGDVTFGLTLPESTMVNTSYTICISTYGTTVGGAPLATACGCDGRGLGFARNDALIDVSTPVPKDFDCDGFADVLVGAPGDRLGAPGPATGLAHLWTDLLEPAPARVFEGDSAGDRFGASVALGDINGDGFADAVIGAPAADGDAGLVYVYFGPQPAGEPVLGATIAPGGAASDFGHAVAFIGDIDGNNLDNLAVGAPSIADGMCGAVHVYDARMEDGLGPRLDSAVATVSGDCVPGDRFGHAITAAGLWNSDSLPDFAVGAPGDNSGDGAVYIFDRTGLVTMLGPAQPGLGGLFGWAVAGGLRLNDGMQDDLLIGAPNADEVILSPGETSGSTLINVWDSAAGPAPPGYGRSLATVERVGDRPILLIGAPLANTGNGVVEVIHLIAGMDPVGGLRFTLSPPTNSQCVAGPAVGGAFGDSLAAPGSVTNDGRPAFIVGAPTYPGDGTNAGAAFVYVDATDAPATFRDLCGTNDGAAFGAAVD